MNKRVEVSWEEASEIPLVPGAPLIGNVAQVTSAGMDFLTECAENYGAIFGLNLAGRYFALVWAPEDMQSIMLDTGKVFGRATGTPMEKIVQQSILVAEGEAWKRLRLITRPVFQSHGADRLASQLDKPLADFLNRMERTARMEDRFDADAESSRLMLDFTMRAIFGSSYETLNEGFSAATSLLLEEVTRALLRPFQIPDWFPTPSNLRFRRARRLFDRSIDALIKQRVGGQEQPADLLGLLLRANAEPEEGIRPLDQAELRNEVASYLIASYETSATTLMWTLILLAQYPQLIDRFQEELDKGVEPGTRYAEAILNESMRLYPAAYSLPRQARQDVVVAGCKVRAGTDLLVTPYLTHRDPRYWERYWEFRPERFLKEHSDRHPHCFLPFGLGPHRCVGMRLIVPVLSKILVQFFSRFRVSLREAPPRALPRVTLRNATIPLLGVHPR